MAVERVFSPADIEQGGDDLRPIGDVTFSGRVLKKDDRYQLIGHVHATLALDCSRCLEAFRMPVDVDVDLTYVPHPAEAQAPASEEDVELADEDLTTAFYRDEVLDLAQMVREQFYLAMPMRPL